MQISTRPTHTPPLGSRIVHSVAVGGGRGMRRGWRRGWTWEETGGGGGGVRGWGGDGGDGAVRVVT